MSLRSGLCCGTRSTGTRLGERLNIWTSAGEPKGRTLEILAVLEKTMTLAPQHPGANHFYIHAIEASPWPQRGVPSAERLLGEGRHPTGRKLFLSSRCCRRALETQETFPIHCGEWNVRWHRHYHTQEPAGLTDELWA